MALALSIIGIFLSVILFYYNVSKYKSSIYLSIFFSGISFYGLYQYILLESKSLALVKVALACIPVFGLFFYTIGPMLYFYVRSILTDNHRLKKLDFLHFAPAIIFFLSAVPGVFVFMNSNQEIVGAIVANPEAMQFYKPSWLSEVFSFSVLFLSRPALVVLYIIWSVGLLYHHTRTSGTFSVFKGQAFMLKWLVFLLGFLFILIISHTLGVIGLTLPGTNVGFTLHNLRVISAIGLAGLLISPFFFPTVLYGLPRLPVPNPVHQNKKTTDYEYVIEERKVANHFETDYLNEIRKKAELCMKAQQPYLESDCNLGYFAKLIHVPAHHLAYYFREELKQSFNDYRNEWRIIHAKNLIQQGKANEMTLEAIGHLSGFTSRNSFFTAFKKVEGIPPGVFATKFMGDTNPQLS